MKSRQRKSGAGGEDEAVKTTIRVPKQLMDRVDALIGGDELPLSKNVWFLQAIKEKVEREEKKRGS
jgi:predicted transcriptional regulator